LANSHIPIWIFVDTQVFHSRQDASQAFCLYSIPISKVCKYPIHVDDFYRAPI
jgi:hypothetical protein